MKSLCIKNTMDYAAGVIYNSCPVLGGYQISSDTENSFLDCDIKSIFVFLDERYSEFFKTAQHMNDMHGYAWECAIVNTGKLLGMDKHYAIAQWPYVKAMAEKMNLVFDVNGEIIEKEVSA